MRKITTLAAALLLAAAALAQAIETNLAFRVDCEVATAGMQSLPDLTWIQGASPAIEARIIRNGKAASLSTNVRCRMLISSNLATATSYAVVTNTVIGTNSTASSMWLQWGAINTNSCTSSTSDIAAAWGYLMFFETTNGYTYWNGAGNLYIERSTAAGTNGVSFVNPTSLTSVAFANITGSPSNNPVLVAYIAEQAGADESARASAALAGANATNAHLEAIAVGAVASNAALSVAALSNVTIRGATISGGTVTTNAGVLAFAVTGSSETGTLAQAAARGGFAGTETIAPSNVTAKYIGIGAGPWRTSIPFNTPNGDTTAGISQHITEGNLLIENTNATGKGLVFLGHDARYEGRAALWLNSYPDADGEQASEVIFGAGTNMTDAGLFWGIDSRYISRTNDAHLNNGRLMIYQGPGRGAGGYVTRLAFMTNGETAVGISAGTASTGANWSAYGYYAAVSNSGSYGTSVGALSSHNATGDYRNAFGVYAGSFGSGNYVDSFGYYSGYGSIGNENFWAGPNAGRQSLGYYNTGIGRYAGYYASGTNWLAIGQQTGQAYTGNQWAAIGRFAGYYGTSNGLLYVDNWITAPSPTRNPTNDAIVLDGNTGRLMLGRPDAATELRGTVTLNGSPMATPSLPEAAAVEIAAAGYIKLTCATQGIWRITIPNTQTNLMEAPTKASTNNSAMIQVTLGLSSNTFTAANWSIPASVTVNSTNTLLLFSPAGWGVNSWTTRVAAAGEL